MTRCRINIHRLKFNFASFSVPVMTIEESRRTQRPYRYGMILLCFGALANWLGLAENYAEPVRYLGVACIIGECVWGEMSRV